MGEANARGQLEPVGERKDVVGEDRPVGVLLLILIVGRDTVEGAYSAAIGKADVAEPAVGERRCAEVSGNECIGRKPGEGAEHADLASDCSLGRWIACRSKELRFKRGTHAARDRGVKAGRVAGLEQRRLTGAVDEIVGHQAVGVTFVIIAVREVVLDPQILRHEEAADQPVEPVAECLALQAQFLGEGLETVGRTAAAVAEQDVEIVEIGILATLEIVHSIRGDRSQFHAAEIIIEFGRHAIIDDIAVIAAAGRDRHVAIIRIVVDDRAEAALDAGDGRRLVEAGVDAGRGVIAGRQIHARAAFLIALGIVADDPDREGIGRLIENLPAQQPAVAIVNPVAGNDVLQEAVTLREYAVDAHRDRIGDRAGDPAIDAAKIVIADRRFAISFGGKLRLCGDDVDQARRGVAAEQGALRPAQHFDPIDWPELGQTGADAATVDAVDEHRDRAFETGVVADRADAADASAAGACFRRGGGDQQRRADLVEAAKIDRARILDRVGGDRRDRERNVAERFAAAGCGHDDGTIVIIRLGGLSSRIDRRRFNRGFRRGRGLIGGRLSECRRRKSGQASRKQPNGFAHKSLPLPIAAFVRRVTDRGGS